jgi:hypothetical protein
MATKRPRPRPAASLITVTPLSAARTRLGIEQRTPAAMAGALLPTIQRRSPRHGESVA